jgi:hypothetical protein
LPLELGDLWGALVFEDVEDLDSGPLPGGRGAIRLSGVIPRIADDLRVVVPNWTPNEMNRRERAAGLMLDHDRMVYPELSEAAFFVASTEFRSFLLPCSDCFSPARATRFTKDETKASGACLGALLPRR